MPERNETAAERADRNWVELLQELRVAQTGVQVLVAFLLSLPFQSRFEEITDNQKDVYLVVVLLSVSAAGVLIAPVALHRAVFQRFAKTRLVASAAVLAMIGLALLGLSLAGVVLLIFLVAVGPAAGLTACIFVASLLLSLWVVLPYRARRATGVR